MTFNAHGDAVEEGENDRIGLGSAAEDNADDVMVTTSLQLGEQALQRVVRAPEHPSQVQPDGLDEAALGSLVHALLAEVADSAEWPKIRARFAARWTLNEGDRNTILTWADGVFEKEDSAAFFEPGCTVECEPEWMNEGRAMRPDRVVRKGDGWHVIDFKTGAVDIETHSCQVSEYMSVLAALENTKPRGWILYLNPWRLVEVSASGAPRIFET